MKIATTIAALLCAAACTKSSPAPTQPKPGTPSERPALTSAACAEQGGEVIGDIGDGAVHRPQYRCASNGEAPIGSIVNDPTQGPVAIEGAVCCKK
jgi:hypothetical protein